MNTSGSAASRFWINFLKTAGILLVCTLISIGFKQLESVREENILMVYLTGVLLVNISTKGYGWGFFSSVVCVFAFNFFFTDPVWTFLVNDPNYIITFLIFLVISTLTGTLAKRLQQHAQTAKRNERQARRLYEISKRYLNLTSVEEIALHALKILSEYQYRCILYMEGNDKDEQGLRVVSFGGEDAKVADMNRDLAKWCFSHKEACGYSTSHYKNSSWQFTPLQSGNHVLWRRSTGATRNGMRTAPCFSTPFCPRRRWPLNASSCAANRKKSAWKLKKKSSEATCCVPFPTTCAPR